MMEFHFFVHFRRRHSHWALAHFQYHLVLLQLLPVAVPFADDHEDSVDDFDSCKQVIIYCNNGYLKDYKYIDDIQMI